MPDTSTPDLSFEVDDLPPVTTEGPFVLGAGHRQAERVRALLTAARVAAQARGWTATTGPVALDVVLRYPPGHRTAQAASLLGGIAAALQDRKRIGQVGLVRLGPLGNTALYADERQIRRLSSREEPAADYSYQVRVTALPVPV
ncbi:MAG TPA: hypothetical protein VGD43_23925 [Micromonospora sp.]